MVTDNLNSLPLIANILMETSGPDDYVVLRKLESLGISRDSIIMDRNMFQSKFDARSLLLGDTLYIMPDCVNEVGDWKDLLRIKSHQWGVPFVGEISQIEDAIKFSQSSIIHGIIKHMINTSVKFFDLEAYSEEYWRHTLYHSYRQKQHLGPIYTAGLTDQRMREKTEQRIKKVISPETLLSHLAHWHSMDGDIIERCRNAISDSPNLHITFASYGQLGSTLATSSYLSLVGKHEEWPREIIGNSFHGQGCIVFDSQPYNESVQHYYGDDFLNRNSEKLDTISNIFFG